MSQKFLHTKIIKAASDDFHAVVPGLPPNENKMSRRERERAHRNMVSVRVQEN